MLKPLASHAATAGRRPPPLRITWAALRNVRLLFSISKSSGSKSDAAEQSMAATTQIASAVADVSIWEVSACVFQMWLHRNLAECFHSTASTGLLD